MEGTKKLRVIGKIYIFCDENKVGDTCSKLYKIWLDQMYNEIHNCSKYRHEKIIGNGTTGKLKP